MSFSIARVPYYISVTVYMAFVAVVSFIRNTMSTGIQSDFYLAAVALAVVLGVVSVIYMTRSQEGSNDDVTIDVAGLPFGKGYYYIAVLGVCVWRSIEGYDLNHNGTGAASMWGMVWLLASLAIAAFTWANYQSFKKAIPPTTP